LGKKVLADVNPGSPSRDISTTGPEIGPGTGVADMIKLVGAVCVAALLAGAGVLIPGMTSNVEAHKYAIKGDRLDLHNYGTACSQRGWPYFETACLRNTVTATREARVVRIVGTDRLPAH
jgi:hypothetical protein